MLLWALKALRVPIFVVLQVLWCAYQLIAERKYSISTLLTLHMSEALQLSNNGQPGPTA